jgi:hypothetical protein
MKSLRQQNHQRSSQKAGFWCVQWPNNHCSWTLVHAEPQAALLGGSEARCLSAQVAKVAIAPSPTNPPNPPSSGCASGTITPQMP